jgi:hypothetical protein
MSDKACICSNWVRFVLPNDQWKHCIAQHHPDCPAADWREYTRLSYDGGSFIMENQDAEDLLRDSTDGDIKYTSEKVMMPHDVFEKLPDFEGH